MDLTNNKNVYDISIRITLPEKVSGIIKKEKGRFVSEYGSKYKSEPHITLCLTRDTLAEYPKEALEKLVEALQSLEQKPFTISPLSAKAIREVDRHRNLYVVDVSNKEQIEELRVKVRNIVNDYQRAISADNNQEKKELEPHITLGEVGLNYQQPNLKEVQENIKEITGESILVSDIVIFFYIKKAGEEKAKLVEEIKVSLRT